ncbi:hypothetical protein OESDEN_05616 [Oesophagostomum dentatum]|uniref:Tc1-like transposase DDE domain-containing protein n=1 Tax=Oesophagostomum dentatum TaxID=61180 RepID=A0A0B1TB15_OESDE|nr:hypothetical protein OESDEN_05616 [Oesophagostomum dentatum]
MNEEGVIPGCTSVIVSGPKRRQDDCHEDMNNFLFEQWLKDAIPHMKDWANGRNVTIVMDNAPYHSKLAEKIPSRRSSKTEIMAFLQSNNVAVGEESSKQDLIAELESYVESRGGRDALRIYIVEGICKELAVGLIRLPPFHCFFFNSVELCWSQMK